MPGFAAGHSIGGGLVSGFQERIIISVLASLLALGSLFAAAQEAPGGAKPAGAERQATLHSVSEEVYLDIVARDRRGKTVRDLTPEQLEVYEDGARQKILSFRFVQEQPATEVKPKTGNESDILREITLVSLVFERLGPEGRANAREAALTFLRTELGPNVYVAVFSSDQKLYVVQPFTRDRDKLTRAVNQATEASSTQIASQSRTVARELEAAEGTYHTYSQALALSLSNMNPAATRIALAVQTLFARITMDSLRFSEQLNRTYEGRSSLYSLISLIQGERQLPGRKTIVYFCEGLHLTPALMDLFRSTVSEANRSNVSIYAVDARGLVTTEVS